MQHNSTMKIVLNVITNKPYRLPYGIENNDKSDRRKLMHEAGF